MSARKKTKNAKRLKKRKSTPAKSKGPATAKRGRTAKRGKVRPSIRSMGDPFSSWIPPFLEMLREGHSVTAACKAVKVDRSTPDKLRQRNDKFRKMFEESREIPIDYLESSALRRAAFGWEEPVIYQGEQTFRTRPGKKAIDPREIIFDEKGEAIPLTVTKFSAPLTIFMLKKRRPDPYNMEEGAMAGGEGGPNERAQQLLDAVREMKSSIGAKVSS